MMECLVMSVTAGHRTAMAYAMLCSSGTVRTLSAYNNTIMRLHKDEHTATFYTAYLLFWTFQENVAYRTSDHQEQNSSASCKQTQIRIFHSCHVNKIAAIIGLLHNKEGAWAMFLPHCIECRKV